MTSYVRSSPCLGSLFGALTLVACAGSVAAPPPVAPLSEASAPHSAPHSPPDHFAAPTSPAPALGEADDDPDDARDPATLTPVLARGVRPSFSKGSVSEGECWRTVSLTGEARQDYASLVDHCGKPTGAIEYAKPAIGRLDHLRDKRDTFNVFLRGGLCYRFFGVADASIPNLDILIERNGALQGEDTTRGPVAIINTDEAWCMDSDGDYKFLVQMGGEGRGRYVFGVWARPGK